MNPRTRRTVLGIVAVIVSTVVIMAIPRCLSVLFDKQVAEWASSIFV